LETSKEELESANEELTTLNEELAHRNSELGRLNGDLINLQAGTKLAILLVGRNLTLRRFSPQAETQFDLVATDIGRPLRKLRHKLELTNLEEFVGEVIARVQESERKVRDTEGRWYLLRVRPYLTLENKVDGAVLVLVDISDLKRTEEEVKAAGDYAEAIIRTMRDPLLVLREDLRVNTANEAFYKTFKTTSHQTEDRIVFELAGGAFENSQLRASLENILRRNNVFNDLEITHDSRALACAPCCSMPAGLTSRKAKKK
jgi:two-component system CheB/CheR fusion protein